MSAQLAIDGGKAVREQFLVFGKPCLVEEEIQEVVDTLRSTWIGTGPKTVRFEQEFAQYVGSQRALAVNSCTAALHLALIVSGSKAVDYIANAHRVEAAFKLFRGNVVGPCFLFRRKLFEQIGPLRSDTPDGVYNFLRRAGQAFQLQPLHARLFFASASRQNLRDPAMEREARWRWRSVLSWPRRAFWRLVDTALVDRYLIRPAMSILRRIAAIARYNR